MSLFEKYFDENYVDYNHIAFHGIPTNSLINNLPYEFVDKFIHNVKISLILLANQYNDFDEEFDTDYNCNDLDVNIRKNINTKRKKFHYLIENKTDCLSNFRDNVLILAKAYDEFENQFKWVYICYYLTYGDCIGIFKTTDSDETVIKNFKLHVKTLSNSWYPQQETKYLEIPLSALEEKIQF